MHTPLHTKNLLVRLVGGAAFIQCLAVLLLLIPASGLAAEHEWSFLDNGRIRLGVDKSAGACIGWFSLSGSPDNQLNAYDVGRYVQQSYYGEEDGSDWNGQPWRYNPVQGGSWRNVPARLLDLTNDGKTIYAKTQPRHWATGALLDEVTMEQWLRLDQGVARLRFRMTYTGAKSHRPRHQELPALFVKPSLDTLVFVGPGGDLERKQPAFPNEMVHFGEPWAAWIGTDGKGVGIHLPHAKEGTCYRVRNGDKGDCSYLAPLQTFALKPGLVFEYETALAIGSLDEIRSAFGISPHASAGGSGTASGSSPCR